METSSDNQLPLYVVEDDKRRKLAPPPALNTGFSELRKVVFLVPPSTSGQLLVDDAPLTPVAVGDRPGWAWKPGFYAGEVRVDLVADEGDKLGTWRLDVSPDDRKLGRDLFFEMLADLLDFDPSLVVGQEPAQRRMGSLGTGEDPLVALTRLRTREASIKRALRAVLHEPMRALRARRTLVPLHRVRRVDRRTAQQALRRPVLLAAMEKLDTPDPVGPAYELTVDVPDAERHYDSPANRCLLAMLRALERRCSDVCAKLERKVENEPSSDTVTGLAQRWPTWSGFLQGMSAELHAATRREPFRSVSRSEITAAGLNAVSAHPLYARFWRLAWEALRTGVEGLEREDLLPLSPTWEIYERWCFVELGRRLEALLPEFEWKRGPRACLEGSAEDGSQLTLRLQPSFGSTSGKQTAGFWSISGQRYPDIVLSWQRNGDTGFVVMDAKYSVTRENVLKAMSSAHIYQDSLRMGRGRPLASVLLVPAPGGAPWLENSDFVAEHRVGVAALRPDGDSPEWLTTLLRGRVPTAIEGQP